MENYCLPEKYIARLNNAFFDDTPYKDEYQDDVYKAAKDLFIENRYFNALDIGTGSGYKLIKYFGDCWIIGVDLEPTVTWLKNKYPMGTWRTFEDLDKEDIYDLVICSDVIEHIVDPTSFINELNKIDFKKIVFSTPDRLQMYGGIHMGPPTNPAHVREWDMPELCKYLGEFYNIEDHFKSTPTTNTQIIVCTKK